MQENSECYVWQKKKKLWAFCFVSNTVECLFILALGLSVQIDETLTISQDKGGRSVFKAVNSRERRMDLTLTHLTQKSCHLKSQFVTLVAVQLDLRAWFPMPFLSLFFWLLTWDFSFVPYPWNKSNEPRDSLSEWAVYIPAEVCLESGVHIKQFFTHFLYFLLFLFFSNSLLKVIWV